MTIFINGVEVSEKLRAGDVLASILVWTTIPHVRNSPTDVLIRNYKNAYRLAAKYAKWVRKTKPGKNKLSKFEKRKKKTFLGLKKISRDDIQKKIVFDVLAGEGLSILQIGRLYSPEIEISQPRHIPALTETDYTSKKKRVKLKHLHHRRRIILWER